MKIVMTLTIAVIMTIFMIIKDDEMITTRITYLWMSVAVLWLRFTPKIILNFLQNNDKSVNGNGTVNENDDNDENDTDDYRHNDNDDEDGGN